MITQTAAMREWWQRSQNLSPLRMWQGLSCLWHPAQPQDRQEGSPRAVRQQPQGAPGSGWRAGGGSLCQDGKPPSLLSWWPHTSAPQVLSLRHQDPAPAEGPPSLLVTASQPTATPPHATLGPHLRDPIQPNMGSTRWWSESGSCSASLFKVTPPIATHTATLFKFWEAGPRLS